METHHITYHIVPYLYTPKTHICLCYCHIILGNMKFVTLVCEITKNFPIDRKHIFDAFNYIIIRSFEHQHRKYLRVTGIMGQIQP